MKTSIDKPKGAVNVVVHLSNTLLTDALKQHLSGHLAGYHFLTPGEARSSGYAPSLILVDSASVSDRLHDEYDTSRTLVVDTRLAHRDIVRLIDQHRIAGVVTANSSIALLDKAMKAVLDGDLWFGRDMVHALISARSGVKEGDVPFENGESLSPREKDVISLICNGYTNKEVAVHLALSEQTIKTHLSRIFKKLQVTNRSQLVVMCTRNGLL